MRFAYADPPYVGCAAKLYGDPTFDDVGEHVSLLHRLDARFDAWAMSLHEPSLRFILPHAPSGVRVAAWVKPFCSFKPGVDPAYTWEPVIFKSARAWHPEVPTVRDFVSASIATGRGVSGAKPPDFSRWLFELLGARPSDEFVDLFPGSGAVSLAWDQFRGQRELAWGT